MDIISVFLERNGNRPSFIFTLFEKLGEVQTDTERSEILNSLDSILRTSNPHFSSDSVPQESQSSSSHHSTSWTRHLIDATSTAMQDSIKGGKTRARRELSDFGLSSSSAPSVFAFANRHHPQPFEYPTQNNLTFQRHEEGKVRSMGISPEFSLDRSPMEPMRISSEQEYYIDGMLGPRDDPGIGSRDHGSRRDPWGPTARAGWESNKKEPGASSLLLVMRIFVKKSKVTYLYMPGTYILVLCL